MNICVVGPSKHFFSGLSVHTICLANAFAEDHTVSAVLLRKLLPRRLYPAVENVGRDDHLPAFRPEVTAFDGMDWDSPATWLQAGAFLRRNRPDAIIMAWWTAAVAHMQLSLALLNKLTAHARLIVQAHEIADTLEETSWPIRLYSRLMGGLLMRLADAIAVHSESVRSRLASTYRLDPRKVFVKPFGLYDVYHCEHGREAARAKLNVHERFTILHFGSMRPYKGIPVLIDAFSRLPEDVAKNCRLVLAGEHWGDAAGVRERVESSPYHDHITFQPHFVPDDMVSWYFSAADLVALPYLRTCGSGVASIAMAYGKPVVASDHQTLRELLRGYNGATFVATGDVTQLSLALRDSYERSVSDGNNVFDAPQRSWHEVVRTYERIMRELDR